MSIEIHPADQLYIERDELRGLDSGMSRRAGAPGDFNHMAAYSLPVINFLRSEEPDVAIGCDRGGRLFGLAVKGMWHELLPDQAFPTLDGKLHFERISARESVTNPPYTDIMRRRLNNLLTEAAGGHETTERERLRVLFIDDCMNKGRVRTLVDGLLQDENVDSYFAVMYGTKYDPSRADVYGNEGGIGKMGTNGLDDPKELGFDYDNNNDLIYDFTEYADDNMVRLGSAIKRVAGIVRIK